MKDALGQFCIYQDVFDFEQFLKYLGIGSSKRRRLEIPRNLLNRKFKKGDQFALSLDVLNHQEVSPCYVGPEIKILYCLQDILVVSKPAGVAGFPLLYSQRNNVLSYLRSSSEYLDVLQVGEFPERGAIMRLDNETSGVLIFARNKRSFEQLRGNFEALVKKKLYLAIVQGKTDDAFELIHFFSNLNKGGKKVICSDVEKANSKKGTIHCRRLDFNQEKNLSLLLVELEQGHRHQIRAQLSHYGRPILGDDLYSGQSAARVFLHCYRYELEFKQQKMKFQDDSCPLFSLFFDLNRCLEMVGD